MERVIHTHRENTDRTKSLQRRHEHTEATQRTESVAISATEAVEPADIVLSYGGELKKLLQIRGFHVRTISYLYKGPHTNCFKANVVIVCGVIYSIAVLHLVYFYSIKNKLGRQIDQVTRGRKPNLCQGTLLKYYSCSIKTQLTLPSQKVLVKFDQVVGDIALAIAFRTTLW
ncbi:hypothetical protein GQ600_1444 [Phytophthora cactorum]|nr:hypothetical protein GQ600_1444 [Phytophthora cactorum]